MGGREGDGNRGERLRKKELEDVIALPCSCLATELRLGELDQRWRSRLQQAVLVEGGDKQGSVWFGGEQRPCMQELRLADGVAEAVVDRRAEYHAAIAQMHNSDVKLNLCRNFINAIASDKFRARNPSNPVPT